MFTLDIFFDISLDISPDISLGPSGCIAAEPSGLIVRVEIAGIDVDRASAGVNSAAVAMAVSGAVADMYCL